jgi:hypothetical protein
VPPGGDADLSRGLTRRLAVSLRLVLFGVVAFVGLLAFLAFLIVRAADERGRVLLASELDRAVITIGDALGPTLRAAAPGDAQLLAEALAPFASPDRTLHLFFTPDEGAASGVFFIAGAPAQAVGQTESEAARLVASGALGDFSTACNPSRIDAAAIRAGPLWSLVPIASSAGCWRLVASQAVTVAASSFIALPPVRSAGLAAAAAAILMLAALALAMAQTRRLRELGDFAHGFAEITAVEDQALLPQPANDALRPLESKSAGSKPPDGEPTASDAGTDGSAQVLDLKRGVVDLSAAVRGYAEAARARLGADAGQLQAEIEDGIWIEGRVDFVRTILEDLVDPALSAPLGGAPTIITLAAEDADGRDYAVLTLVTAGGAPGEDAGGRLSLVKQFIVALGALVTSETRADGADVIRLRFARSAARPRIQKDVG